MLPGPPGTGNVAVAITKKIIIAKKIATSIPKNTRVMILVSLFFDLPQSQNRKTQKNPKEKVGSTGPESSK